MENILFLCIGDSNIVGDSLGPLIGSFLEENKYKYKNIKVAGTIENPIRYKDIDKIKRERNQKRKNNIRNLEWNHWEWSDI